MKTIAFLGLGAMGSRMATNLIAAGYSVTVWNRSPGRQSLLVDQGARLAETPRAAAQGADAVIAMLRDDAASHSVWLDPETGALPAMKAGSIAIECSTLTARHVTILAQKASARGIGFVDAPVAGSRLQAEARQLIFMAGGTEADVSHVQPLLMAMGGAVHQAGGNGAGAAVKLALNALFGIQVAAVAEAIGALSRAGLDPARAIEIIGATPVASPAARGAALSMLAKNYAPMFPIDLAEKDFGYFAALSAAAGADTPLADAARNVLRAAISRHMAGDNITGVMQLYT